MTLMSRIVLFFVVRGLSLINFILEFSILVLAFYFYIVINDYSKGLENKTPTRISLSILKELG